jgi:hypothetical protein
MPNQHNEWPEADIERLKQLMKDGLSSRLIGKEMGRTKGSIIGKINRLGLTEQDYPRKCAKRNRKADHLETLQAWGREAARKRWGPPKPCNRPPSRKTLNRWGPPRPPRLPVDRAKVEMVATLIVQQAVSAPLSKALLIDALTARTCKWMAGDPKEGGTYCGHGTLPGRPYCGYHEGRAHYAGSQADFDAAIDAALNRQPKDRILIQEAA